MNLKAEFEKLKSCWGQKNKLILFFIIGLLLMGFSRIRNQDADMQNNRFQIDTIIPVGYVLIPIKLLNAESISAVIGSHGVADIYTTIQGEKSRLLFSRAKIIKSAVEDSTFSVLVKETKAHLLSQNDNPFFAAVQNPKAKAIETDLNRNQKPEIRIIYQN